MRRNGGEQFTSIPRRKAQNAGFPATQRVGRDSVAYAPYGILRHRPSIRRNTGLPCWYAYEAWQGEEKLYWYNPQPHPDNPFLQSTHPHHKHIPPNLNRNRVPAPAMSFTQPNLLCLIPEIESVMARFKLQRAPN